MTEIIDFKSKTPSDNNQPITEDEARFYSIYDVVVSLIIDIDEGTTFSMNAIKERMIEVIEIIQEEV